MAKIVIGNWKMNGSAASCKALVPPFAAFAAGQASKAQIVICPPFTLIPAVAGLVRGSFLSLGAQDVSAEKDGAHTGDISAAMLKDSGCSHVIVGHSERRSRHNEGSAAVKAKAQAAIAAGLVPVVCVGETLAERESGQAVEVVSRQVRESAPVGGQFLLAYEPVWAIGSGKVPTSADIGEMHRQISSVLPGVKVLYGGSVKAANAAGIMAIDGVAGVLVGGASLDLDEFCGIIAAAEG